MQTLAILRTQSQSSSERLLSLDSCIVFDQVLAHEALIVGGAFAKFGKLPRGAFCHLLESESGPVPRFGVCSIESEFPRIDLPCFVVLMQTKKGAGQGEQGIAVFPILMENALERCKGLPGRAQFHIVHARIRFAGNWLGSILSAFSGFHCVLQMPTQVEAHAQVAKSLG